MWNGVLSLVVLWSLFIVYSYCSGSSLCWDNRCHILLLWNCFRLLRSGPNRLLRGHEEKWKWKKKILHRLEENISSPTTQPQIPSSQSDNVHSKRKKYFAYNYRNKKQTNKSAQILCTGPLLISCNFSFSVSTGELLCSAEKNPERLAHVA